MTPLMTPSPAPSHRPFTLVLAGGGGRGMAHVGVLRALEHAGFTPSAIVGVSMGAIVGATYALNPDWYRAFVGVDLSGIPRLARHEGRGPTARLLRLAADGRNLRYLLQAWGPLTPAVGAIMDLLEALTLGKDLEAARLPFAAVATDLRSGQRVVLREGRAAEAIYASSALAGVLPPASHDGALLADGAYVDVAPVDVARSLADGVTIAVNPSNGMRPPVLHNGLQVLQRSIEIAYQRQAAARLGEADFQLQVTFPHPVATTDFLQARTCIAAGIRAVRGHRASLQRLLERRSDPSRTGRRGSYAQPGRPGSGT
jgi:NTE family protein